MQSQVTLLGHKVKLRSAFYRVSRVRTTKLENECR